MHLYWKKIYTVEGELKRGCAPLLLSFPLPRWGFIPKVVIPVKTGIQYYTIRHDF